MHSFRYEASLKNDQYHIITSNPVKLHISQSAATGAVEVGTRPRPSADDKSREARAPERRAVKHTCWGATGGSTGRNSPTDQEILIFLWSVKCSRIEVSKVNAFFIIVAKISPKLSNLKTSLLCGWMVTVGQFVNFSEFFSVSM